MRDRYSLVVGLLFALVLAIAAINTLGSDDQGTLGLDELERHWPLPEFAVPAAAGRLEGDANVAQDDCETSQDPCPTDARRQPACRIRTSGAIRVCDFFERPLVLSFWFSRGGNCAEQQDVVDEVYARYRDRVGFLSLDVRDDRETVRDLLDRRKWTMPVGYDRDGAVAALYRVGGCPTFAYAYPGGTLHHASIGEQSKAQLEAHVDELLSATRAAEIE
ncbi:MAG TPA: TlpA disulfide reductase family protein [Solirubrobacterales bacterium]|nr:TlpA disulfide reductase family protein [Solirubrobacterales bacterium]